MTEQQFAMTIFAPAPPARWVYPEVAAAFAELDPAGWPLRLYCEATGQWIEFEGYEALQAAVVVSEE